MARLTLKENGEYRLILPDHTDGDMSNTELERAIDQGINKLGQLEDIEEKLGIDLDTLFKVLRDGFYRISLIDNDLKYKDLYDKKYWTEDRIYIITGEKQPDKYTNGRVYVKGIYKESNYFGIDFKEKAIYQIVCSNDEFFGGESQRTVYYYFKDYGKKTRGGWALTAEELE